MKNFKVAIRQIEFQPNYGGPGVFTVMLPLRKPMANGMQYLYDNVFNVIRDYPTFARKLKNLHGEEAKVLATATAMKPVREALGIAEPPTTID